MDEIVVLSDNQHSQEALEALLLSVSRLEVDQILGSNLRAQLFGNLLESSEHSERKLAQGILHTAKDAKHRDVLKQESLKLIYGLFGYLHIESDRRNRRVSAYRYIENLHLTLTLESEDSSGKVSVIITEILFRLNKHLNII